MSNVKDAPNVVIIPKEAVDSYIETRQEECRDMTFYEVRDMMARKILDGEWGNMPIDPTPITQPDEPEAKKRKR